MAVVYDNVGACAIIRGEGIVEACGSERGERTEMWKAAASWAGDGRKALG